MNYIKKSTYYLIFFFILSACAKPSSPPPPLNPIIPQPQSIAFSRGRLDIKDIKGIYTNMDGHERGMLLDYMKHTLFKFELADREDTTNLQLIIAEDTSYLSAEAYDLSVDKSGITIKASARVGLFYGIQSLLQLVDTINSTIPFVKISDSPRFAYRGMMLDVSRHFNDKEFIKKQLDMMAYYKLNRFHWHLTDGAGWRIEIKKYPQLTQQTAYRTCEDFKEWTSTGKKYCAKDTPGAYGGFYTRNDIREVVAYAHSLGITVIPEIEMPGHSEEVLAAFPELSCSGKPYVNSDFCIGNDQTFVFIENVLTEVMELFPSEYIHIGGDEATKEGWKTCAKCKKRMRDNGMKSVDQLQSYMIHRIELFLNKNGRKLLGWDEILDGGLAPNATVMSWRGEVGGIQAAKAGHDVVMAPNGYCYLDSYQAAPTTQPEAMSGFLPIRKVYSYNPVSAEFSDEEAQHVIGLQGNVWTEFIRNPGHTEYMIWPRLMAIAEVGWTQPENKSYDDFYRRALQANKYLKTKGYNVFDLNTEVEVRPEARDTLRHLAFGRPAEYATYFSPKYKANGRASLTDGLRGDWSYSDGRWQGFIDSNIDVVIDLGKKQPVQSVDATFMQDYQGWIWMPGEVEIFISDNDKDYSLLATVKNDLPFEKGGFFLKNFGWHGQTEARYIRYLAKSSRKRDGGWLFTDEIIIE